MMADHALLSPSAAHRWLTCPGSVAMEARSPRTTSDSAEYGTACHELAEKVLNTPNALNCIDFIGAKTKNGYVVTKAMTDLVQVYVDNIRDYAQGNRLYIEQKVDFSKCVEVADSFGTSDAIITTADGEELQVHDLKTGYHIVHAEDNPQLKLYALGWLSSYGYVGIKRIRLVIHQPSQNHLDEWDCSLADLLDFAKEAKFKAALVADALAAKEPLFLNAEEKACQYCKAAATCPALAAKVATTVGAEFEDLTGVTDIPPLVPKDPALLGQKMAATGLIENWIKSVRAEVERELFAGSDVPGFKLVTGKMGNRKWMDEKEVLKVFKAIKLTKDQMYNATVISPTEAEKILKIAPDKWKKVEPFITRSVGAPSVAPESDKRARLVVTPVGEQFDDLTGSDLV